jgi:hypothetical protein
MSPQELLDRLTELFPDFASHWNRPQNCFRGDDGSFSHCGAFAEFSHFFQNHYERLPKVRIKALGLLLIDCMKVPDSELDTAAATCFLENVAGERFSDDFRKYLDAEPLAYYSQW